MKFQTINVWYIMYTSNDDRNKIIDRADEKDYPYFQEPNTGRVSFLKKKHAVKVAKYLNISEDLVYHGLLKFVMD